MNSVKHHFCFLVMVLSIHWCNAQLPTALKPEIVISKVCPVKAYVVRLAVDPISGKLYYATYEGKIYLVVRPATGSAYDSLVYDISNHGIDYVQGMCFFDSTLYLSGNVDPYTPLTAGRVVRAKLQPDGSRTWSVVAQTEPYETADYFDHLMSGLILNAAGDTILLGSGARGDHGEIQTRYGLYPGIRNKPITTVFLQFPADADSLWLPDDDLALESENRIFARGLRNTYDLAYNGNGDLIGVENSGGGDMDDEMNWVQQGKHYGFPWVMGNLQNPQQFPDYDPNTDIMINHESTAWKEGFCTNDPTFPPPPAGVTFTQPCANVGPDADKFRDTLTGEIKDGSDVAKLVYSFTAHRSPLGIVFDNDSALTSYYRGHGFVSSWTRGDSTLAGYSKVMAPFGDFSEDLLHFVLTKNEAGDNYYFTCEKIVTGFQHPVDAEIIGNSIYVIETSAEGTGNLWQIEMPAFTGVMDQNNPLNFNLYPNPANHNVTINFSENSAGTTSLQIFNSLGDIILDKENLRGDLLNLDVSNWAEGVYFVRLKNELKVSFGKLMVR